MENDAVLRAKTLTTVELLRRRTTEDLSVFKDINVSLLPTDNTEVMSRIKNQYGEVLGTLFNLWANRAALDTDMERQLLSAPRPLSLPESEPVPQLSTSPNPPIMTPSGAQDTASVSAGVPPSENELCFVCGKVEDDKVGPVKKRKVQVSINNSLLYYFDTYTP